MNGSVAWRAAVVQGLAVAVFGVVLGLTLPHSFFEDYGWAGVPIAVGVLAVWCGWLAGRTGPSVASAA